MAQDEARERSADDPGDGVAGHQQRHHRGAAMRREPVGEVEDHARKKPGLRDPEQQARGIKLEGCVYQRGERGNDPPRDDHATDPHARTHPVQDDVAGNLEGEVAEEEDARADSINALAEFEIAQHL
jgi:hypothetical protein